MGWAADKRSESDLALLERLEKLYVAVVADCFDGLGVRRNLLAPHVRSLYPGARLAGYALTVMSRWMSLRAAKTGSAGDIAAVDSQQLGDVMVVSTSSGSYWGGLLATASRVRDARGIVGDCYARDTASLIEIRYPTFVAGSLAYDSLGRIDVEGVDVPIECAGVTVHPGNLVIGDDDGVAIIPRGVADEVVRLAEEKVSGENVTPRPTGGGHVRRRGLPHLRRALRPGCCSRSTIYATSMPTSGRAAQMSGSDFARRSTGHRLTLREARVHHVLIPMVGLYTPGWQALPAWSWGFVELVTNEGPVGTGEWSVAIDPPAHAALERLRETPAANLLDDESEIPLFMAWWDLVGQVLGKPLHELWADLFDVGFAPPIARAARRVLVAALSRRRGPRCRHVRELAAVRAPSRSPRASRRSRSR